VTTDKLAAYKNALEKQFTHRPYHYVQRQLFWPVSVNYSGRLAFDPS
jgi:hypothetical protein